MKHIVAGRIIAPLSLVLFLLLIFAPVALASPSSYRLSLLGPKKYYLALGDSLAFSYQPDLDFRHGYVDDFYSNLQSHGVQALANMSCPGETSNTFIKGGCPYPYMRKYLYTGAQLAAAVSFLKAHPGQVSPVTLEIGADDVLPDVNASKCTVSSNFANDLATLDSNLTKTILPQLVAAMTVNGKVTGDLVVMNYYDPYQNTCSNSVSYTETLDRHLANDVSGYGTFVDVFKAFGGAKTPNPNTCTYTWMCSIFKDMHATTNGYSMIASAFENGVGY